MARVPSNHKGFGWRECVGVEPTQDWTQPPFPAIALDLYSHVIPSMQREAAAALDDVLAAGR